MNELTVSSTFNLMDVDSVPEWFITSGQMEYFKKELKEEGFSEAWTFITKIGNYVFLPSRNCSLCYKTQKEAFEAAKDFKNRTFENFVTVVTQNTDTTEGRGSQKIKKIFKSFSDAWDYCCRDKEKSPQSWTVVRKDYVGLFLSFPNMYEIELIELD